MFYLIVPVMQYDIKNNKTKKQKNFFKFLTTKNRYDVLGEVYATKEVNNN